MPQLARQSFTGPTARDEWRASTRRLFHVQDVDIGNHSEFQGEIRQTDIADVSLSHVFSSREFARRTSRHVAEDREDVLMLVNVVRGAIELRQGAWERRIGQNTFALYRASRPYEWRHSEAAVVRNVAVPGALLGARTRAAEQLLGCVFEGQEGAWSLTGDYLTSLMRNAGSLRVGTEHCLAAQIVDLIALAITSDGRVSQAEGSARHALYQKCRDVAIFRLRDHDLNPDTVAARAGVSTRSLYRLFSEHGETFQGFLLSARLEASRLQLQDPFFNGIPVSSIGYQNGFRSHSHFAAAFKSRFGVTPSACRNGAAEAHDRTLQSRSRYSA